MVKALEASFASNFVNPNFTGVKVSIEYPLKKQDYPSIWLNYEDQDSLTIAGIDHHEYVLDDPNDPASPMHEVTRWMYSGEITLTFVALSSRERDDLYDEFIRVFAFSKVEQASTVFRTLIEDNPFIVVKVNWDELRPHGDNAAQGTPWGTEDEVIYEKSLGFDVEGEFVSDPTVNGAAALLSQIIVIGTNEDGDDEDDGFTLGVPRIS